MSIEIRSTDRITLAGLPGTGKTTLSKYLAALVEPHCLIYDPLSQYDGFPDECRYIPKSDSYTEFDAVCRRLRARGNITFLIEESERYLGQGRPMGDNTFDLLNRGRNWGVGIIAVTRRIQRLSKDFFDLCHHMFLFRVGLKSREYIADLIGWEDTRKVMRLPLYHFLYYCVETEQSSVHVLKLGRAISGESYKAEEEEGKRAKEGKIEEVKVSELQRKASF